MKDRVRMKIGAMKGERKGLVQVVLGIILWVSQMLYLRKRAKRRGENFSGFLLQLSR
jgi:uncharacterized membrane protein